MAAETFLVKDLPTTILAKIIITCQQHVSSSFGQMQIEHWLHDSSSDDSLIDHFDDRNLSKCCAPLFGEVPLTVVTLLCEWINMIVLSVANGDASLYQNG